MRKLSWNITQKLLVIAVGIHSIIAGMLLLLFPLWTLKLVGWDYTGQVFWPSQAGLFLALLGIVYLSAIRLHTLIWFLILSKLSAVIFLMLSIVLLDAPRIVIALATLDGLMGLCVALVFWKQMRAGG